MKKQFRTLDEVIDHLEEVKQQHRDMIGNTRTKLESNEAKGYVQGVDEAVYHLRQYQKAMLAGPPEINDPIDDPVNAPVGKPQK